MMLKTAFFLALCLLQSVPLVLGECQELTTVEPFDIEQYASLPWYIHQQAENSYSSRDDTCVSAQYTVRENPTFPWGYTVDVFNQATYSNGREVDAMLCAFVSEESDSKLNVAPCFLPKIVSGPYWVVAYDEAKGYALISGGQPTIETDTDNNLCTTGTGTNNSGLWIFLRTPERDEDLINEVRDIAVAAGLDVSILFDISQEGCYDCADDETGCDAVAAFPGLLCFVYGSRCPETCGLCE